MAEQTFTFVVLPNGSGPAGKLKLSVLLTPRLGGAATLAAFPDVLRWPQLVAAHGISFDLACAGSVHTAAAPVAQLRPDVWTRVFTQTTFVEKPTFPDFADRLFVSYPVRSALSYLKYAYQTVAGGALGPTGERGLESVLEDLVFRDGSKSTLDQALAHLRVDLWNAQQGNSPGIEAPRVGTHAGGGAPSPDGTPTTLTKPAATRDVISRFALFHSIPPAPNRPPLPQSAADFAKTLDFHRALTALTSYPSLLRALGLVFDLEVPDSLCPPSPAGGAYGTIEVQKVTPGFSWALAPTFALPSTTYRRHNGSFFAAPATDPSELGSGVYAAGDVVDGFLALPPSTFHLLQLDLDGALLNALSLADNMANVSDPSLVGDVLPALRSSGIGLIANDRALQLLDAVRANAEFDGAVESGSSLPRAFTARDLTRGYRLDVWSSRRNAWHSLHRRDGVYRFGAQGDVELTIADEEGFLQPAVAHAADDPTRPPDPVATAANIPQPETDLHVHERIANWSGWSLSADRPGLALNRSPDPAEATTPDATRGEPMTPFKMTTAFTVRPGSLPELRFGDRYRLRARAVDLAGNSVEATADSTDPATTLPDGGELPYQRFEPVPPPLVVLQQQPRLGSSLEQLVIRSNNSDESLDASATWEADQRHVGPPKTSVRLAEQHGAFDDAAGHLRGDAATYGLIVSRDSATIPTDAGVPLDPGAELAVSYLPDPIGRGAALRDLPNTLDNTNGYALTTGLAYDELPDVQPRAGSVTFVDFGSGWPDRRAFRLALVEGNAAPRWDDANRLLVVSLPKAAVSTVELSSYVGDGDLELMGVWGWLRELFEAAELAAVQSPSADLGVTATSDFIALLTRFVREGGHALITPSRQLSLVHAVQQPLGRPMFVQLPVLHRPTEPILVSGLRNSFTPITAWRFRSSHSAVLLGALRVHGASTARIDVEAAWREVQDNPADPGPTHPVQTDHVESIQLAGTDAGLVFSDASEARAVAVYVPKVDALWFAAPFDELDGVDTPGQIAAPQHHFADTKHRWVGYRAVAASRFQEYFEEADLDFTRTGPTLMVDVPSSARPLAPQLAYVVPTFGWQREEASNVKSSVRLGNGLRIYLERPWYSSGADELLGVVLWPEAQPDPDYVTRETFKPYFTQWGADPIWESGQLAAVPHWTDFPAATASATGLPLEGTPLLVDVAGHPVGFDEERSLWYCDLELSTMLTYAPFVRLALARYQPHSIEGVELSRVVLADFAQLTPTRSAVLTIDPGDTRGARLFVGGLGPTAPTRSEITVSVEQRIPDIPTDLGWEPAPAGVVNVVEDQPPPAEPEAVLWSGSIEFAAQPTPGTYRVVIREFERIEVDAASTVQVLGERLVYAATLPYDYPAPT
jgi:hypothetical protein